MLLLPLLLMLLLAFDIVFANYDVDDILDGCKMSGVFVGCRSISGNKFYIETYNNATNVMTLYQTIPVTVVDSFAITPTMLLLGWVGYDSTTEDVGAAYIYLNTGSSFVLQQTIIGTNYHGYFGSNFAIQGNTLLIVEGGWSGNKGRIRFFTCSGSGSAMCTEQTASAISKSLNIDTNFGTSLSFNGQSLISSTDNRQGNIYIHFISGTSTTSSYTFTGFNNPSGVQDNYATAIATDNQLFVAGQKRATVNGLSNAGIVYTFSGSTTITQGTSLYSPTVTANAYFGCAVVFDSTGQYLYVGSYGLALVFVYQRTSLTFNTTPIKTIATASSSFSLSLSWSILLASHNQNLHFINLLPTLAPTASPTRVPTCRPTRQPTPVPTPEPTSASQVCTCALVKCGACKAGCPPEICPGGSKNMCGDPNFSHPNPCGFTEAPTPSPTLIPSIPPSFSPTYVPGLPTPLPTHRHTHKPTSSPTLVPSSSPTLPTSSPTPVRYTITLCGANCSPWDYISFPDQTANWIWNDGNARSVAAANEYIQFNKDFTSSSSYSGTVYANCDDNCYVYFNNQLVAHQGGWNNRLIANVNVVVGSNTIIIVAWNDGYNPAGLIASLHNPSNNAVVHTDNSWIWSRVSSSTSFVPSVSTPQPTNSPTLMPTSSPTLPTTSLMNTKGKIDRKGIAINGTTSAFLDISVSNNGNFILYSTKEKLLLSSNYGNSFTSMGWPSSADYSSSSTSITNDGIIYVSSSGNNYAYINGAWISFSTTYCKLPFQSPDTGKSMVLVCDRDWTVYVVKLEWNSLTSSSAFSWNGLHSMGGESIGPITSSSNMDSFLVATSHTFVDYNCGGPGYLYLSSFGSSWSRLTNIFQAGLNRDYFASVSMSSDGKVMIASSIRGKKVWNCNSIYDVGSALETGHIYGSSNYGKDWKRIDPNWEFWTGGDYKSVSCNDDCSVIMATAESDTQNYLMVSSNFGLDWTIDNTTLRSNKVAGTRSSTSSFYSFEYNVAYSVNFTGPSMQPTLEPSSSPTRGPTVMPTSSPTLPTTSTVMFAYTGAPQTYTVPVGISTILVEAYGASGSTGQTSGGKGGFLNTTLSVLPGQVLQVTVGGSGDSGNGYNGGGQGTANPYYNSLGGGATDIRVSPYTVGSRVIVVGGGGGGAYGTSGACGGGLVGCRNSYSSGGSQTAGGVLSGAPSGTNLCCSNGALAQGGAGTNCGTYCCGTNGAGGGGFYGGAGGICDQGGAGGSSYANASSCVVLNNLQGVNSGNGYLRITPLLISHEPSSSPTVVPTSSPTLVPSSSPSGEPSPSPTPVPTSLPPSMSPSKRPGVPTPAPTRQPKRKPKTKKRYTYMTHSPSRKPTSKATV